MKAAGRLISLRVQREEAIDDNGQDDVTTKIRNSTPKRTSSSNNHCSILNYISPASYMANRPSYLRRNGPGNYSTRSLSTPNDEVD